jgi:Flp pilus assembly protein CpaB
MVQTLSSEPAHEISTNGNGRPTMPLSLASPKHRRPSWVVAGVALVALAALLGAWVFSTTTSTRRVVVAARTLGPGEVLAAGDLRVVELGHSSGLRALSPDREDLIVGRAARGPIPAGTVLNTDLFADRDRVLFAAGDRVIPRGGGGVGAALAPGAAPVAALAPGDRVNLIGIAKDEGASGPPVAASVLAAGTVWSVQAPTSNGGAPNWWVSVLVPASTQATVAQAAADGRLRLSLVGASG